MCKNNNLLPTYPDFGSFVLVVVEQFADKHIFDNFTTVYKIYN